MGSLLSYEHWMPDEDPTFYVPATINLSDAQKAQLESTGFRQGEPFMLTKDGALTRPASKKFALRGMKSSFSIRKNSLMLFEESPGHFSLVFSYFTDEDVILEIHLSAVDASSSKYIKLKGSEMKWGPYRLSGSQATNADTKHTDNARSLSLTNIRSNKSMVMVDASELDDDNESKDDDPPLNTTGGVKEGSVQDCTVQDNVVRYTQWSSRKLLHMEQSSPLPSIQLSHLPSIANAPTLSTGIYDVVLIVTSAEHVRSTLQQIRTPVKCAPINGNVTPTKPISNTYRPRLNWLPNRSKKRIIPTRQSSITKLSSQMSELEASEKKNIAYTTLPPVDLSDNPHSEAYQKVATEPDATEQPQYNNYNLPASRTSTNQNNDIDDAEHVTTTTGRNKESSANCVQREAFFFRVNQESFNKRHTTNAKPGSDATLGTDTKSSKRKKSTHSAENKTSISSSMYMRSKGVCLDLNMQLFQVPSGVYNRITLYGMEGFIPPPTSTININSSAGNNGGTLTTTADSRNTTQRHTPTTTASTTNNTNNTTNIIRPEFNDEEDRGAECIICLSSKQNTIMFPCRHLCLCSECAATVATHENNGQEKKCPVCRKPVIVMFQLKS